MPKEGSWLESGIVIVGSGFLETTSVAFKAIGPEESLAVRLMSTFVNVSFPASCSDGVPDNVRVSGSRESHFGPASSYVIGRFDEKVDFGKVYEKSFETRAI